MTEEQYRELQERVHILKELSNTVGWLYLTDFANERLLSKRERLRRGMFDTLEEYKAASGYVQGAELILELPALADKILDDAARFMAEQRAAKELAEA